MLKKQERLRFFICLGVFAFFTAAGSFFSSCNKEEKPFIEEPGPKSSFAADASSYSGGDTIRLKDNSSNAFFYTWTILPENKKFYTKELDYILDPYDTGGTKTITLTVAGKNGAITNDTSIKVDVAQGNFSTDYFSCSRFASDAAYIKKQKELHGDQVFFIMQGYDAGVSYNREIVVRFLGTKSDISSGTYQVKNLASALSSNQCYIYITDVEGEYTSSVIAYSGSVQVTIDTHSFVHILFSNLAASGTRFGTTDTTYWSDAISGNITCY